MMRDNDSPIIVGIDPGVTTGIVAVLFPLALGGNKLPGEIEEHAELLAVGSPTIADLKKTSSAFKWMPYLQICDVFAYEDFIKHGAINDEKVAQIEALNTLQFYRRRSAYPYRMHSVQPHINKQIHIPDESNFQELLWDLKCKHQRDALRAVYHFISTGAWHNWKAGL